MSLTFVPVFPVIMKLPILDARAKKSIRIISCQACLRINTEFLCLFNRFTINDCPGSISRRAMNTLQIMQHEQSLTSFQQVHKSKIKRIDQTLVGYAELRYGARYKGQRHERRCQLPSQIAYNFMQVFQFLTQPLN